jgi:hypothetical protein
VKGATGTTLVFDVVENEPEFCHKTHRFYIKSVFVLEAFLHLTTIRTSGVGARL